MKCHITNKVRYITRREAEENINGPIKRCYFCSMCLGFHLTHRKNKNRPKRVRQRY